MTKRMNQKTGVVADTARDHVEELRLHRNALSQAMQRIGLKRRPTPSANYASSPLLRLPRELRDQIWHEVLAPGPNSRPAHFHIYDTVYDSCTYSEHTDLARQSANRRNTPTTSILRTCRAIYEETIQILYDTTPFELVVLAGLPRPKHLHDGNRHRDNLRRRNCLGRPSQCKNVLHRIRNATVIFQPGESPSGEKYRRRIDHFIKAIDYGQHMSTLTFRVNIGWRRGRKLRYTAQGTAAASVITDVLAVLCNNPSMLGSRDALTISLPTDEYGNEAKSPAQSLLFSLSMLCSDLFPRSSTLRTQYWTPHRYRSYDDTSHVSPGELCLSRGTFGDQSYASDPNVFPPAPPPTRLRDLLPDVPMYLFVLALTPAIVVWEAHRKVEKGESWRVSPTNLLR